MQRYSHPGKSQLKNRIVLSLAALTLSAATPLQAEEPGAGHAWLENSLVIDVEGNRLTSRFINDQGEVRDEFSIEKKNGFVSNYSQCLMQKSDAQAE